MCFYKNPLEQNSTALTDITVIGYYSNTDSEFQNCCGKKKDNVKRIKDHN